MNKFRWIVLRNACTFAEVVAFLALEKLIDIETSSVSKIALVFSLQNLFVILMFLGSKIVDRWNRKLMLILSLVSLGLSVILKDAVPYWVHLNIVFFLSYIMYSIVPATSSYLENIAGPDDRASYLTSSSLYRTIFQVAVLFISVYTLSNLVSVQVYLGLSFVFVLAILLASHFLKSFAPAPVVKTTNWFDIFKVLRFCWKMFVVYGLFCLITRGVIVINQQYLKEVFDISGYEFSLPYKGLAYIGGLVASLIVTTVIKNISFKTYTIISLVTVLILSVSIYYQSPILIINCFGFLLGIANYGMTLYFNIEIHRVFSGTELKHIAILTYLLPFLTAFLAVTLFSYASTFGVAVMNTILFAGSTVILVYVFSVKNVTINKSESPAM